MGGDVIICRIGSAALFKNGKGHSLDPGLSWQPPQGFSTSTGCMVKSNLEQGAAGGPAAPSQRENDTENSHQKRSSLAATSQQIHDVLMRNLPGKDEPHQVLLMLDEFFALGRMTSLASKIAVSAGYGFRMAIILQNLSQLDELYGKATRETLIAGCAAKLFVAINDNATAQYVSEALGNYTTDNRTKIVGTGITQSARISVTKIGVPLRRPEALMKMPRDKSLLLIGGIRPMEVIKVGQIFV